MTKSMFLAAVLIFGSASGAAAQQAAIPTPPKTVNPTPQPTTGCRGCSDDNEVKKKPLEAYDKKPTDSVAKRASAAPTKAVAPKSTVTKPKPKAIAPKKKHTKRPVKKSPVKHPLKAKTDSASKK